MFTPTCHRLEQSSAFSSKETKSINNDYIEKCHSRYLYNLLTAPRTVSDTYSQVVRAQSCAKHVQHVRRLPRATCRAPSGRDRSAMKSDRIQIAFILALVLWLKPLTDDGEETGVTRRKPPTTRFRKSYILKSENLGTSRDSKPHYSSCGRRFCLGFCCCCCFWVFVFAFCFGFGFVFFVCFFVFCLFVCFLFCFLK